MAQTKVYDWVEAMAELSAAPLAGQMEHQWVERSVVSKVAELDGILAFE